MQRWISAAMTNTKQNSTKAMNGFSTTAMNRSKETSLT